MTTKTATLQGLIAKAMKGASCNKMIPLTNLMAVIIDEGRLMLITTDSINYLYVSEFPAQGDKFYAVVQADLFSKLISKLTCENVTLELNDGVLNVKGNGNYSIELPLNEEGELITYPDPITKLLKQPRDVAPIKTCFIDDDKLKFIHNLAKASIATTNEIPCYTGYYLGDSVIATDTYKICGINDKPFETLEPMLFYPETVELFDLLPDSNVIVNVCGNEVWFGSPGCTIYCHLMDCIEDFQVDAIQQLLDQEFTSTCKVAKTPLLQLLDRLSLFVSQYDKNGIYITFTRAGIQIDSKQANSTELIPYIESENFKDFTCCADIEMLQSQVKVHEGDSITIQYGEDNALKIVDGDVTQIIVLMDDDR